MAIRARLDVDKGQVEDVNVVIDAMQEASQTNLLHKDKSKH